MTKEEIKEAAEGYRLALMTGFATIPDVVAWAEGLVGSEAEPDFEIIELASAAGDSLGDLVSKLTAVQGDFKPMNAVERLFACMGNALTANPASAQHIAWQLRSISVQHKNSIPTDIQNKISSLADGDKLHNQLTSFLEPYRSKYSS